MKLSPQAVEYGDHNRDMMLQFVELLASLVLSVEGDDMDRMACTVERLKGRYLDALQLVRIDTIVERKGDNGGI